MLSGRYADVLSGLFLGYSTLWYTSHHKNVKGLDKVTDFAMQVNTEKSEQYRCLDFARMLLSLAMSVVVMVALSKLDEHVKVK